MLNKMTTAIVLLLILATASELFAQIGSGFGSKDCSATRVNLKPYANLTLGAKLETVRRQYPNMVDKGKLRNTMLSVHLVRDPMPDVFYVSMLFSGDNKLSAYLAVYKVDAHRTIHDHVSTALQNLGIGGSRRRWDLVPEAAEETVVQGCRDFYLYFKLERGTGFSVDRNFTLIVMDSRLKDTLGNPGGPESPLPPITNEMPIGRSYEIYPDGASEYAVEFPGKPTVRQVTGTHGTLEEATFISEDSVLRVEYGPLTPELKLVYGGATNFQLREIGIEIAKLVGYTGPVVSVSRSKIGTQLTIRGYKVIQGIPALIEHRIYVGKKSHITLIVAARSADYPTRSITRFLGSFRHDPRG